MRVIVQALEYQNGNLFFYLSVFQVDWLGNKEATVYPTVLLYKLEGTTLHNFDFFLFMFWEWYVLTHNKHAKEDTFM